MLSVSNSALKQLHQSLQAVSDTEDDNTKCFRIMPKDKTSLTLNYSEPAANDTTFEFEGAVVLAVPKELEEFCNDKNLDVNSEGRLELV
jgi:hypothetical protein